MQTLERQTVTCNCAMLTFGH